MERRCDCRDVRTRWVDWDWDCDSDWDWGREVRRARAPDWVVRRRECGGRVSVLFRVWFWREEEGEGGGGGEEEEEGGMSVRVEGKCGVWKGGDWVGCRREPDRVEGSIGRREEG